MYGSAANVIRNDEHICKQVKNENREEKSFREYF